MVQNFKTNLNSKISKKNRINIIQPVKAQNVRGTIGLLRINTQFMNSFLLYLLEIRSPTPLQIVPEEELFDLFERVHIEH